VKTYVSLDPIGFQKVKRHEVERDEVDQVQDRHQINEIRVSCVRFGFLYKPKSLANRLSHRTVANIVKARGDNTQRVEKEDYPSHRVENKSGAVFFVQVVYRELRRVLVCSRIVELPDHFLMGGLVGVVLRKLLVDI
jgi:hypothetical protein